MYCTQCGSTMDEDWVACPSCGHRWGREAATQGQDLHPISRTGGWYPNKRQWFVIWIVAVLIVSGLMIGGDGFMFALCSTIVGSLLVWKLQYP